MAHTFSEGERKQSAFLIRSFQNMLSVDCCFMKRSELTNYYKHHDNSFLLTGQRRYLGKENVIPSILTTAVYVMQQNRTVFTAYILCKFLTAVLNGFNHFTFAQSNARNKFCSEQCMIFYSNEISSTTIDLTVHFSYTWGVSFCISRDISFIINVWLSYLISAIQLGKQYWQFTLPQN